MFSYAIKLVITTQKVLNLLSKVQSKHRIKVENQNTKPKTHNQSTKSKLVKHRLLENEREMYLNFLQHRGRT